MTKLFRSRYLRQVSNSSGKKIFIYHVLFGNPMIFNKEGLRFLDFFKYGRSVGDVHTLTKGNPNEMITALSKIYFLVPVGFNEREILYRKRAEHLKRLKSKKTIDHISLSISNVCNFGCGHCMFFQRPNNASRQFHIISSNSKIMKWEIAKKCIDSYARIMREVGEKHGRIHFGNAEPLLNWPVIKKVLEYCESSSEFSFEYGINTNLWLLNEDIAKDMKKYKVRIATSLDGLKEANNAIRVTKSGKGTFQKLLNKFNLLTNIGYPLDSISITVTPKNFYFIDKKIIDFAVERYMTSIAFDYDLINLSTIPLKERIDKIIELKSYAESHNIFFGGTWGAPFRKLMSISMLRQTHAFCAAAEGLGLTFNPNGAIKVCDYSTTNIGHVDYLNEIFEKSGGLHQFVADRFPGLNNDCKGCVIEGPCGGQCYITREVANKTSKDLIRDMCDFYRTITERLIKESLK